MLKILCKRGEIAPEEQFLLLSTIFCYLMLDLFVKRGIRFSLRDKRLFEITEVEITRVDCIWKTKIKNFKGIVICTFSIGAQTVMSYCGLLKRNISSASYKKYNLKQFPLLQL